MNLKSFDETAGYLPDLCFSRPPDLGIILGSGWGDALLMDEVIVRIPYADMPGFGASTVKGHAGEFIMFNRHSKVQVVLPVEIWRRMCCPSILLTNASGGINPALKPGDFVVIRDHINLTGLSPLIGAYVQEWGERFPDMTEVYNRHLAEMLHAAAHTSQVRAMDGVYAYAFGPCYETPAEIRAYKAQGADVVGMSTVPEAVFAKACGMKVAGLSLVSNMAAGISIRKLDHAEVVAAGDAAKPAMRILLDNFISRI